ncbi:MAG TPA: di-heme-cytochrome C peroxidase [Afifellaceae bacterium]|nr:di-heme-cytochrome C peroxidase [Afifellaceae bacterium]
MQGLAAKLAKSLIGVLLAAWFAHASAAEVQPAGVCGGNVRCLDQGWTDAQRAWWYTVSQGSRLLPLSWALALETPDGTERLFGAESMAGYGYIVRPRSERNRYGLPVGFAVDRDSTRDADLMCDIFPETCLARTMREPWLGMNCSACHTAEIEWQGRRMRIEGAPTLADFDGFTNDVLAALRATLADRDRFSRFAREVLGNRLSVDTRASLERQVREQIAWMVRLKAKNDGAVVAGHGRLDAQGHILNKVSLVVGARNQLADLKADAPASYPFIWNTAQQQRLQWNGIARNILTIPIRGRDTDIGALVRNVSEVIGVFAHVEPDRGLALLGYDSSVRVRELVGLERLLETLRSPRWPEDLLPQIDWDTAAEGRVLFERKCSSCHADLASHELQRPADETMTPLLAAGTDVFLACNTFLHRSLAGNLAGQKTFAVFGDRIEPEDFTHKMLVNVAVGSVLGRLTELASAIFEDVGPAMTGPGPALAAGELQRDYLPGVTDPAKKAQAALCLTTEDDLLAYKARPLNGIWATAPYLHNGSVPTLYDLLLPARLRNVVTETETAAAIIGETRPERFGVGSRHFDPDKVGFVTAPEVNPFLFEVRREDGSPIPGNFNSGHDYGNAELSEEERRALVEYMKTL